MWGQGSLVVVGGKGDILRYLPARRLSSDSLKGQCQTGQGKNCSFHHFVVLRVNEGAYLLSFNDLLQVAYDIHVEDVDRQLVVWHMQIAVRSMTFSPRSKTSW